MRSINVKNYLIIVFFFMGIIGLISMFFYKTTVDISIPYSEFTEIPLMNSSAHKDTVFFGVISRYPSNIIYHGYQPLMDFLTKNTEYHFELVLSNSYSETVDQLVNGKADAAFLGSYIYVLAHDTHGITCILRPLNENREPFFRAALITHPRTGIQSINDLPGKRLALPSRQSFSGNWLPLSLLKDHKISISDLDTVQHFPYHQTVVYEILRDNFDAGIVKERVAHEYRDRGIIVFGYSDTIPGSPIVVPREHDISVVNAVKDALLSIDPENPGHAQFIQEWDPEFAYGFIEAKNEDYDMIRNILNQFGDE